jgi:hypothetical protein
MKITNVKAMVAKGVTVALLAGAFAMVAPVKAEAQQFAIGVRVGYPVYARGYYGPDYYARQRFEQERRHAEWVRAHEYARFHNDHRRGW